MSTAVTPVVEVPSTTPNGAATDWRATLPDELKSEKSLESFKGVDALAKSYVEAQKYIGGAVKLPKADAPAEEWEKVYARLGRPETPDKYEFKRPEVPENVTDDEEMETAFKGMAHKAGLSTRQAQQLLEQYNEMQVKRLQSFTGKMEEGVASLKKEWGTNFDKNIGVASRAVKELGGDELTGLLNETGLGNHPVLIKFFSKLGEQMQEDTVIMGDQPEPTSSNADAIQLKLDAIRKDKNHPYNSRMSSPAKEAAIREVNALTEQLLALTAAKGR